MDMYTELKKALENTESWAGVDIKPFIKHIKKFDDSISRDCVNRCISRSMKKRSKPNIDTIYNAQQVCTLDNKNDFIQSICCPYLYDESFYIKLLNEIDYLYVENTIDSKLFNPQAIIDGLYLAKSTCVMDIYTAECLLSNLNNICKTNRCSMCVYLISAVLIYENIPLVRYKEEKLVAIPGLNNEPLKMYIDTGDIEYLLLFSLLIGKYSAWYREIMRKVKTSSLNKCKNSYMCFKNYKNGPTTLNYSMSLDNPTDIEKAYIEVGKEFYCDIYDWLTLHIINKKGLKEFNVDGFNEFIEYYEYITLEESQLIKTAHKAVFKYILSK